MNKSESDFRISLQNNLGVIKSGIWNGTSIGMSYGGTGTKLSPVAGGLTVCNATAMEILPAGSIGQLLTSGGTAVPTWSTLVDLLDTYGLAWLSSNTSNSIDGGFPSDNYNNIPTIDGGIP